MTPSPAGLIPMRSHKNLQISVVPLGSNKNSDIRLIPLLDIVPDRILAKGLIPLGGDIYNEICLIAILGKVHLQAGIPLCRGDKYLTCGQTR